MKLKELPKKYTDKADRLMQASKVLKQAAKRMREE